MAHLGSCNDWNLQTDDTLLPEGEVAVLVCLMAVPVIWTVLVAPLVSTCALATMTTLLISVVVGGIADVARLVWLHRHLAD